MDAFELLVIRWAIRRLNQLHAGTQLGDPGLDHLFLLLFIEAAQGLVYRPKRPTQSRAERRRCPSAPKKRPDYLAGLPNLFQSHRNTLLSDGNGCRSKSTAFCAGSWHLDLDGSLE
jgi:hypothetical protein